MDGGKRSRSSRSGRKKKGGDKHQAFPQALYAMISDSETDAWIRWSEDGESFEVHSPYDLEKHVFSKYFRHSKFSSFQRQLYTYKVLKKAGSTDGVLVFAHESLKRGREDLLGGIVRHLPDSSGGKASVGGVSISARQFDSLVRSWESERSKLWDEIAGLRSENKRLGSALERLERDNTSLWCIVEDQERSQELLKQGLKAMFYQLTKTGPGDGAASASSSHGQAQGSSMAETWAAQLFNEQGADVGVGPIDGDADAALLMRTPSALFSRKRRKEPMDTARSSSRVGGGSGGGLGGGVAAQVSERAEAARARAREEDRQSRYVPLASPRLTDLGGGAASMFGPPSTWTLGSSSGPDATTLVSTIPTGSSSTFKRNLRLAADSVLTALDRQASERAGLFKAYQDRRAKAGVPLGVNLGARSGATGSSSEAAVPGDGLLTVDTGGSQGDQGEGSSSGRTLLEDELGEYPLSMGLENMDGVEAFDTIDPEKIMHPVPPSPLFPPPLQFTLPSSPIPIPSGGSGGGARGGARSGGAVGHSGAEEARDEDVATMMRMSSPELDALSRSFSELDTNN